MRNFYTYPVQASTIAGRIDAVFFVLTAVAVFFSLLIAIAIITFAVRYRKGHKVDRSNPPSENLPIELVWTIVPLLMAIGLYGWATSVYFSTIRVPDGAMDIYVVGKQWMWKLQHPEGRWEMNELHVPVGRPIKLTMISEDVIHSFFVPAFRVKQDVVPGRYSTIWFQPTQVGTYRLYCAQFCGTNHSGMTGYVTVMDPADYQRWLSSGATKKSMAAEGEGIFRSYGCTGCHGLNSGVRAPLLDGIYGRPVAVQIPRAGVPLEQTPATTVIADDRYIRDHILLPGQEVAAGFKPIMPSFKGRISEEDLEKVIAYVKSLSTTNGTSNGLSDPNKNRTDNVSESQIKARTGFTPPNMGKINQTVKNTGRPSKNERIPANSPGASTMNNNGYDERTAR